MPYGVVMLPRSGIFDPCQIPASFVWAIAGAKTEADLMRVFTIFARRVMRGDRCSIVELLGDTQMVVSWRSGDGLLRGEAFDRATSFLNEVLLADQVVFLPDTALHPDPKCGDLDKRGIRSVIAAPITMSGTMLGVLTVLFRTPPKDPKWQMKVLGAISRIVASQLTLLRQVDRLAEEALRDGLTGALNRKAFDQALVSYFKQKASQRGPLSIILVDIDHFKRVNDRYGHPVGDAVLRRFVRRLSAAVRETDGIYRLGGEEFAILLPGALTAQAVALAHRALDRLRSTPIQAGEVQVSITASFGVAAVDHPGLTPDKLLNVCDRALYAAKGAGRNRVMLWAGDEAVAA